MRPPIAAVALLAVAGLAVRAQDETRSALSGVFTAAQADTGRALYAGQCASCHGDALTGGEMAPALAGGDFLANWTGLPVYAFFDRVRGDMPADSRRGTLSREKVAQITAFILNSNGYPAGPTPLPTQDEVLKTIRIDAKK